MSLLRLTVLIQSAIAVLNRTFYWYFCVVTLLFSFWVDVGVLSYDRVSILPSFSFIKRIRPYLDLINAKLDAPLFSIFCIRKLAYTKCFSDGALMAFIMLMIFHFYTKRVFHVHAYGINTIMFGRALNK